MTTAQTNHYRELSAEYLRHARELLAEGDLPEALERGWDAVASELKVAANERGLPHDRHRELWVILRALIQERGDTELGLLFGCVQTMHINFYDVPFESDEVEWYLDEVERLVGKLGELV